MQIHSTFAYGAFKVLLVPVVREVINKLILHSRNPLEQDKWEGVLWWLHTDDLHNHVMQHSLTIHRDYKISAFSFFYCWLRRQKQWRFGKSEIEFLNKHKKGVLQRYGHPAGNKEEVMNWENGVDTHILLCIKLGH